MNAATIVSREAAYRSERHTGDPADAPLLEVTALSAWYGRTQVLHDVDLAVREGSITTLLGPNGAGKTSTLRAICQMIRAEGDVRLGDLKISDLKTERIVGAGVAHVPDGRGTFNALTVEENLRLGAYRRRDKAQVNADIERMYAYFPVLKVRHRQQAGTLSGGEQQMLAISRSLMSQPRVLLLDEPSFGLAPKIVREIFALMKSFNERERLTILLVEQNAALSFEIADQVYLMESGRIALSGSADDLRHNDLVRKVYLGG